MTPSEQAASLPSTPTLKHTPGPWSAEEVRHGYDQVVRGPDRGPICLVQLAGYGKRTGAANSSLIAAAPELLDALRMTEAALVDSLDNTDCLDRDACICCADTREEHGEDAICSDHAALDAARSAIAKASGLS